MFLHPQFIKYLKFFRSNRISKTIYCQAMGFIHKIYIYIYIYIYMCVNSRIQCTVKYSCRIQNNYVPYVISKLLVMSVITNWLAHISDWIENFIYNLTILADQAYWKLSCYSFLRISVYCLPLENIILLSWNKFNIFYDFHTSHWHIHIIFECVNTIKTCLNFVLDMLIETSLYLIN